MKEFRFFGFVLQDSVSDDNFIFKLHYKVTFWLLLVLGFILGLIHVTTTNAKCASNDFTEPATILCTSQGELFGKNPAALWTDFRRSQENESERFSFDQLIYFRLLIAAIFFYLPRLGWQLWEGGRMQKIARDLNRQSKDEDAKKKTIAVTADYIRSHATQHTVDFIVFGACELLNLINVVVQLSLLNRHLGNILLTHGLNVVELTNESASSHNDTLLLAIFPRIASCYYKKFGASGDVQFHSAVCNFPNNNVHEKVFVLVLIWLLVLAVLSCHALIYRAVVIIPKVRWQILDWRYRHVSQRHLLRASRGVGDWFIVNCLSNNVDLRTMSELIHDLEEIQKQCVEPTYQATPPEAHHDQMQQKFDF